jgi:hypothetical protein
VLSKELNEIIRTLLCLPYPHFGGEIAEGESEQKQKIPSTLRTHVLEERANGDI